MNKLNNLILIAIFLIPFFALSQSNYNKVGGVGFRIDDSQYYPSQRLMPLDSVFNARGLKFTHAVSFGIYTSQALLNYLHIMQLDGDQIADHTPDHETRFFDVPFSDVSFYEGREGVDHIDTIYNSRFPVYDDVARICLKIDHVRTNTYTGEGLIDINGSTVTSVTQNEFFNIKLPSSSSNSSNADRYSMNAIYIPSIDKLFKFEPGDVTGNKIMNLTSFWDEDVDLTLSDVSYHKVGLYDVFYKTDALRVMAERTQRMCDQNGITSPSAWIQPGGYHPQFHKADIKQALEQMGYFTAGVFADPVPPYYNAYDPDDNKRYGINWEDFNEEYETLGESKKIIADRFAKHYVSIGHSHLLSYDNTRSFPDYLQRTADILDWCLEKGIPVKTYDQWAELLYKTPQNPYVNVMPKLENDLDADGIPDGFIIFSNYGSVLDKLDGPNLEFPYSVSTPQGMNFLQVQNLAGIEKGENHFALWIKGFQGNIIGVRFTLHYDGGGYTELPYYFIRANSTEWQKYDLTNAYQPLNTPLIIPVNVNTITINIKQANDVNGTNVSKVAGFELRGKILPPFLLEPTFNINTKSVPLVWQDNSNNEAGFRVRRMFEHENVWKTLDSNLAVNSTIWVDSLLDFPDSLRDYDFITVYYQVQAYAAGGFYNIPSNIDSIQLDTDLPLPVELSSFSAKYKNKLVILDWTTETEVNNYGFEIERRVGSIQSSVNNYEKIGFVQGNGNSNSPKKYSFKDENLLGGNIFYYRLKQIDNDGQFAYSNEIEVDIIPAVFTLGQNYPNPFNPFTKIRYQLPEKNKVSLKVFNSLGEEVTTLVDEIKDAGNYEVDFSGTNLPSGVYFYRMQAGDFISTKKMVIIK